MKTLLCFVILLVGVVVGSAQAEAPQTLVDGSWVCRTPEAYDQAVEAERQGQGKTLSKLRAQLLEKQLCMYVDDEYLEDLMAPYVKVLTRQGDKVHVSFSVEFYKRIEFLHRKITRVRYAGWTAAGNLRNFYQ